MANPAEQTTIPGAVQASATATNEPPPAPSTDQQDQGGSPTPVGAQLGGQQETFTQADLTRPTQPQQEYTPSGGPAAPPQALKPEQKVSPGAMAVSKQRAQEYQHQGEETFSAADLAQGVSPEDLQQSIGDSANHAILDYKTATGLQQAFNNGQISKPVAQHAISQLQKTYNSASPDEQKAIEAAEADAAKPDQKQAEDPNATPAAGQYLSALLAAGVPGVVLNKLPFADMQAYLDQQHQQHILNDADYQSATDKLNQAKDVFQNDPRMRAGLGLAPTYNVNQMRGAWQKIANLVDQAVPDFWTMRPQQATTEIVKGRDNFIADYKKFLQLGPRPSDPTGPGVPLLKKNPDQLSAYLDQGLQDHQEQLGHFTVNQEEQKEIDQAMIKKGLIPQPNEYLTQRGMGPKVGAETGATPLAVNTGMALASILPMPWDPALEWLWPKIAEPLAAGGEAIGGGLQKVGSGFLKKGWATSAAGAGIGTYEATKDAIEHPKEFFESLTDPGKFVEYLAKTGAEIGTPALAGALIGSPIWGTGWTSKAIASVLRSSSPFIRPALEAGTGRALSTEIPFRATQGPVTQALGRTLESYVMGAGKGAPFAALADQGDWQKFMGDINQFGLYGAMLRAPQNVIDSLRGGTFDRYFTYKGESPNKNNAPPQARYGASYYDPLQGKNISLDPFTRRSLDQLDPSRAATFTHLQDMMRPYGDAHMLPDDVYAHVAIGQGADPDSYGFTIRDPQNSDRLLAIFRGSKFDTAALHEMVGHVAYRLLGAGNQQAFNHLLSQTVDMDSLANTYANKANPGTGKVTMSMLPDQAEVNPHSPSYDPQKAQWSQQHGNLTKERAYEEAGAETLQALYSGQTAEKWTQKPSLLRQFAIHLGASAEGLGLRATTPDVNGPLGVQKSVAAAKMLDLYLHDFATGNIPPTGATKAYFPGGGAVPFAPGAGPAGPAGPITLGGGRGGGGAAVPAGGFATAKPANVLAVHGGGAQPQLPGPANQPPAAPGGGPVEPAAPDESVIRGLMKQGFTREQAQDFAARGTVSPVNAPRQPVVTPTPEQPQPPKEERPAASDTPEAHARIKAQREAGIAAGEAQAQAEGKKGQTLQQTGEEKPAYMPSGVTRVPTEGFRLTAYGPAVSGDQPGQPTYDKNSYRGIGDHNNQLVNHYSASLSPEARSSIFPDASPNHSTGREFFYAGNTYRDDDTAAQYFRGRNQGKVIDIFHSGGQMPSGGGTETAASMPGGGGGGGPMAWTPYRGPAPTYPWSAPSAQAAPEAPTTPVRPAEYATGPADTGTENVPVSQAPAAAYRGGAAEPEGQAMQMAQFTGGYGGGYGYGGYGGIIPGVQPPEAPAFMPSGKGGKLGKIRPETEAGEPVESTLGEPNVKGFERLTPLLSQGKTKEAQKLHASLLSADDSRVKKQADNFFKGEHFVKGDPMHMAALADVPHNERMALAAGQTAIANKTPMHMSYISAPPHAESPITRASREVSYEASSPQARLLGQTNARLAGHSVIPTAIGISTARRKGDPNSGYIQGISTSVAAHNHYQLNHALAQMGQQSPYPELNSDKFHNDFAGYVQNLLAGHRGTGDRYQPSTKEFPANPDKNYVPYRLKQREADFLNAIINNQAARHSKGLQELARAGGTLLSEEGETNPFREAIDRAQIKDPEIKQAADERWSNRVLEPTIRTFKAGLVHALHERPEDIPQEIRPKVPGYEELTQSLQRELGSERGRPDIAMAAAFMPGGKKRPAPLSPEEHAELTSNIRKQFLSGKLRQADYMERLADVPEPGQEIGPAYMPMAGRKAQKFAEAEKAGRTFETPLPGGGRRFEIDDRDMEFKPASNKAKNLPKSSFAGVQSPPRNALEERYATDPRGTGKMPLSDAIRHPELFENYPFLRNTTVSMDPTIRHYGHHEQPWVDEYGDPRGDHIVIKDPTDKETLAHEIQHAVQFYEGFSGKGSNTEDALEALRSNMGVREELRKQWDDAHPERTQMSTEEFIKDERRRTGWQDQRLRDMAKALYWTNPGEVEARVAGRRAIRLTPEQRAEAEGEGGWKSAGGPPEEYTPKEDVFYEMASAATRARKEALMSPTELGGFYGSPRSEGIAYMPGGKEEFQHSSPEDFIRARNKSKRPQFLSPLEPGDIREHKLYMNEDHTAGAAVSPEGDIQNVFNNGGGKGAGQRALAHAIRNGGTHLDAYDPYLPSLYRQFGFKETGRMKFNRDYAPPNWNFEEDDDPDIAFMAHQGYPQGGEQAAIERASGPKEHWLPNEQSTRLETDWDQAKNRSRAQVSGGVREASGAEAFGAGEESRNQAGGADRRPVEPPEAPGIAYMVGGKAKKAAAPQEKLEKPKNWDEQPEEVRQAYLEKKVARTIGNSYKGKETHPLEVDRDENGGIKYDPNGNPIYKKRDYNIVNSPLLGKKGLDHLGIERAEDHPDEIDPEQHTHLNQVERSRLSAMRRASAVSTMGDKIVESFMGIKDKPAIMAGKGWYSRMREKLAKALGEHHELFAQLLGATSAKTPVRNNFIQALDALEQFKSGAFDRHRKLYLEAYQKLKEGGKDALVAHMRDKGIPLFTLDNKGNRTDVEDHDSDAAAMANWIAHHGILPRQKVQPGQKEGAKYNANSLAVLRALAGTWLHEVDAPKTPNFAGNLSGRTLEATIDVWAARHIQRLGYEGLTKGKAWRAMYQAEPGVSSLDFAFSQDAMRDAAEKISKATGEQMNPDDLQAILWFAEKHHYEEKGWTRGAGAAKSSFDDVADLAFPKTGEPMTSDDLRNHYEKIRLAKEGLKRGYETHPKEFMRKRGQEYIATHKIQPHHLEAARAELAREGAGEEEEEAA